MRVLVTGGAGFIGSHLVDELVKAGHEVQVIDDCSSGSLDNVAAASVACYADLASFLYREVKTGWLEGAVVYHLAARADISWSQVHPFDAFRGDVNLTAAILEEAVEAGASRVIFTSSSAVYGQAETQTEALTRIAPATPYGASKLAGESLVSMIASIGIPALSVRPFNVYGPRQRIGGTDRPVVPTFLMAILRGAPITIEGTGQQSLDFVFVKDAAEWLAGLMDVDEKLLNGGAVNLGSGTSLDINSLAEMCMAVVGHRVDIEHAPARDWYFRKTEADVSRMLLYGPRPDTSLDVGLAQTMAYYRDIVMAQERGEHAGECGS